MACPRIALPFTVSTGSIYFVSTSGSDNNPGTFAAPWATLLNARNAMQPGDITYAMDGVSQSTDDGTGWDSAFLLSGGGQGNWCSASGSPRALAAYPGASVTIGNATGGLPDFGLRTSDCQGNWCSRRNRFPRPSSRPARQRQQTIVLSPATSPVPIRRAAAAARVSAPRRRATSISTATMFTTPAPPMPPRCSRASTSRPTATIRHGLEPGGECARLPRRAGAFFSARQRRPLRSDRVTINTQHLDSRQHHPRHAMRWHHRRHGGSFARPGHDLQQRHLQCRRRAQ